MSRRDRSSHLSVLPLALVASLVAASSIAPREAAAQPAQPGQPKSELTEDFYKVPGDNVAELKEFIVKLLGYQPKTRQEALRHQKSVIGAIRTAANKMLKLEEDKTSDNYKMAEAVLLQIDIQDLRGNQEVDAQPVVDRTLAFVKKIGPKVGGFEIQLLMMLGDTLEYSTLKRQAIAPTVYKEGAAMLKKAEDAQVREYADKLEAMGRRLELPGKKLKLTGTTVDGQKFDMADYKGKVVLVDFWATWCGPCLEEIPNMLANYKRFHAAGFEIVGISLDKDRERLEAFLKERKLPWLILHENNNEAGHPAADYYGVHAIPAMFLVDREGVVISTAANGVGLSRLLESQFPKVVEAEKAKEAANKGE